MATIRLSTTGLDGIRWKGRKITLPTTSGDQLEMTDQDLAIIIRSYHKSTIALAKEK